MGNANSGRHRKANAARADRHGDRTNAVFGGDEHTQEALRALARCGKDGDGPGDMLTRRARQWVRELARSPIAQVLSAADSGLVYAAALAMTAHEHRPDDPKLLDALTNAMDRLCCTPTGRLRAGIELGGSQMASVSEIDPVAAALAAVRSA